VKDDSAKTDQHEPLRKLAIDLHFQPSEIDRMQIDDALWWLID
jgi:hypothetical protein